MTLKSDLNVGWPIPIVGDCCIRFGAAKSVGVGLLIRIGPTGGGGGINACGVDGGNDVTVASGINGWRGCGLANDDDAVAVCDLLK